MPPNLEMVRAVKHRRLDERVRNGHHELAKQEDEKRAAKESRNDQWQVRIHPAKLGKQDILGNHRNKSWNKHG